MTQITRLINGISNQHHDYDYTQALVHLTRGQGGVCFSDKVTKGEFDFVGSEITPGVALVKITRTTSTPIGNQKSLCVFYSDANVPVLLAPNRKYYIEIDNAKINDPLLITDAVGSNNYLLGYNIGEIKVTTDRPTHTNYIKLWSTNGSSAKTDERSRFMIDASNVNMSDIKQNIVSTEDINADGGAFTSLLVYTSASLPTSTTFGGVTIQNLVNSYITGNLLTEFMATDTEAKAGTSETKFINPKQAKNNYGISQYIYGFSQLMGRSDTSVGSTNTLTKLKEIKCLFTGSIGVKFDWTYSTSGGTSNTYTIFKNGSTTGQSVTMTANGSSGILTSTSISVSTNDLIQLYSVGTGSNHAGTASNFRIYCDTLPVNLQTETVI